MSLPVTRANRLRWKKGAVRAAASVAGHPGSRPSIEKTIAKGTLIHTDEYDIDARLEDWGYGHKTVCHDRLSCPRRIRAR